MTRIGKPRLGALVLSASLATLAIGVSLSHDANRRSLVRLFKRLLSDVHADSDTMGLPSVMFWAWERPDDLSTLDPQHAGVAFLVGTIYLRSLQPGVSSPPDEGVVVRPRLQPLRLRDGTPLMVVVRIETLLGRSPEGFRPATDASDAPQIQPYTEAQRARLVGAISSLAEWPGVRAVQIDFDATRSEQGFYLLLLKDLRQRLPARIPISITALTSWCIGDPWLEKLPPGTINEAVPMLFRMGPDGPDVVASLKRGEEFRVPACQSSLGVSTDESFSRAILNGQLDGWLSPWRKKRLYVFSAGTWSNDSAKAVIEELRKWHEKSSASRWF